MALNDPTVSSDEGAFDALRAPAMKVSAAKARTKSTGWRKRFSRILALTDFAVLVVVVFGTQLIWFGTYDTQIAVSADSRYNVISYWVFSVALLIIWMWALAIADSRAQRVIGDGIAEYARVLRTSFMLFGAIAIVAFLAGIDLARGYLLISLPSGIILLLLGRWLWRQWLIAQRKKGEYSARVILVGSPASVDRVGRELRRARGAGYLVVGACVVQSFAESAIDGIPVLGGVDEIRDAMTATGADTVAITSTGDLSPRKLKELSWGLTPGHQHLILAPSLVDVAGPRIHTRPIAGLPLIHVETPHLTRGQILLKRLFDLIVGVALLVILSPLLLVVALMVKINDRGPALFGHERVGQNGKSFRMWKFRSMRNGADAELVALLAAQGTQESPLFKVKNDPRITRVGRVLRKYSLDELPQLFNVLGGSMSLVGPRPQVAGEVALYSDVAMRRLMVRPGITGLWQVSGRSTLSWEEAVRLDLFYVENWSLWSDIVIMARTVTAVVTPGETAH